MKQTLSTWQEVSAAIAGIPAEFLIDSTRLVLEKPEYSDAFSKGQLASKLWLIQHLKEFTDLQDKKILICGGWIGTLAKLLLHYCPEIEHITSIDIDWDAVADSNSFVNSDKFSAIWSDMVSYRYYDEFDIIINTSYEHLSTPHTWMLQLPRSKVVIIQSNNATQYEDHVNTHESLQHLSCDTRFVLEENTMQAFELHIVDLYQRYMVIGHTFYD